MGLIAYLRGLFAASPEPQRDALQHRHRRYPPPGGHEQRGREAKPPRCKFCKYRDYLAGPEGGLSINIKCSNCGAKYNWAALSGETVQFDTIAPPSGHGGKEPLFQQQLSERLKDGL